MKRTLISLLLIFLLFCLPSETEAMAEDLASGRPEFVRIFVPEAQIWASVQKLHFVDGVWEKPNYAMAWIFEEAPQVFYVDEVMGFRLHRLLEYDLAYLHRDWLAEDEPVRLRVERSEVIRFESESDIWQEAVAEVFALVTYRDNELLVVWFVRDCSSFLLPYFP